MTDWASAKLELEHERYTKGLVQWSQMVEDGRLSSTAAREVLSEFYDAHQLNIHYIKQIDTLFEESPL